MVLFPARILVPGYGRHSGLGFYYTALKAQVPIVLAYIDYKDKQIGLTQSIIPSGNVEKEMTEIKNFYRNRQGKHPENFAI